MDLGHRLEALLALGLQLSQRSDSRMMEVIHEAEVQNPWFTKQNIELALQSIADEFLTAEKLELVVKNYHLDDLIDRKNIGLILAGNIPLVGFHDILCTFITGHKSIIKPAEKDRILTKYILESLRNIDGRTADYFEEADKLKDFDAVIATGSNQTSAHFEWYFRNVPHIIRKNRNSLAVLSGNETDEELHLLGSDIFSHFGFGCRNVSKIFVPNDFEITNLFDHFEAYKSVIDHNKYKNNFDYNLALFLLNKEDFRHNDFLILKEAESIQSRIGVVHWQKYATIEEVVNEIKEKKEEIQCVVSRLDMKEIQTTAFGHTQCPGITDFADGTDTIQFLLGL